MSYHIRTHVRTYVRRSSIQYPLLFFEKRGDKNVIRKMDLSILIGVLIIWYCKIYFAT